MSSVVAAVCMASLAAVGYDSAPKVQARAEILWTKPICVETNRYIGWPSVCRLKNGDILAVFSGDRDHHVCPYGKVQMIRTELVKVKVLNVKLGIRPRKGEEGALATRDVDDVGKAGRRFV